VVYNELSGNQKKRRNKIGFSIKPIKFHAFHPKAVNNAALAELALGRSSGLLANKSFPFCTTVVLLLLAVNSKWCFVSFISQLTT
jgi:hypothetical protein